MKQMQVGEVILFESETDRLYEFELFAVSNDLGVWVNLNDIMKILDLGKRAKKKITSKLRCNDVCKIFVERDKTSGKLEEYFIRDSTVYDIIFMDKLEQQCGRQFINEVIGKLNGHTFSYDIEVKYANEIKEYVDWLESDEDMFIAHKNNNKIDFWSGPSIDEAVDFINKFLDNE